jgi:hypothetical protein
MLNSPEVFLSCTMYGIQNEELVTIPYYLVTCVDPNCNRTISRVWPLFVVQENRRSTAIDCENAGHWIENGATNISTFMRLTDNGQICRAGRAHPYNVVGMLKVFYAHARDRPRILA